MKANAGARRGTGSGGEGETKEGHSGQASKLIHQGDCGGGGLAEAGRQKGPGNNNSGCTWGNSLVNQWLGTALSAAVSQLILVRN